MSNWRSCISQNVASERINDLNDYVSICDVSKSAPIDQFYSEIQSILALFPFNTWGENTWVGALSSIAVISSVENYFRQIFSQILKICVDSQKNAASKSINLGSVIWHPSNEIERGAFEHISLASADNINNTSKTFIGIDLKANGLGVILSEFDKICELRHGIVHSGKVVAGKNGIKLKLQPTNDLTKIDIGFDQFQEIMSICNALVVDSNKLFFAELSQRWATTWRNTPSWDNSKANLKFKTIWHTFFSSRDYQNRTIPEDLTWIKCRNQVMQEFNI
ncbi:hypothetical protein [Photobacterium leiognathi]|uniref:hypothetical protein n=1 Tax=Photobacterium leiognathi TaxID=553611 RepID=UPI002981FFCD|nr:hypothetical protein [Photobacterium leiognathi]